MTRLCGPVAPSTFGVAKFTIGGDPDAPGEISSLIGAMTASHALLPRLKAVESPMSKTPSEEGKVLRQIREALAIRRARVKVEHNQPSDVPD